MNWKISGTPSDASAPSFGVNHCFIEKSICSLNKSMFSMKNYFSTKKSVFIEQQTKIKYVFSLNK